MTAATHLSSRVLPITMVGFRAGNRCAPARDFRHITRIRSSRCEKKIAFACSSRHGIANDLGCISPKTAYCPPAEIIKSP